jgi:hypothetical protein
MPALTSHCKCRTPFYILNSRLELVRHASRETHGAPTRARVVRTRPSIVCRRPNQPAQNDDVAGRLRLPATARVAPSRLRSRQRTKADRDCNTGRGAGDDRRDACPITRGTGFEDELLVLVPRCALPPGTDRVCCLRPESWQASRWHGSWLGVPNALPPADAATRTLSTSLQ